jgi:hypothetical protein
MTPIRYNPAVKESTTTVCLDNPRRRKSTSNNSRMTGMENPPSTMSGSSAKYVRPSVALGSFPRCSPLFPNAAAACEAEARSPRSGSARMAVAHAMAKR